MTIDTARPVTAYVHGIYADPDDADCRRRYIRVIIHPGTDHLVAAGHAHNRRRGGQQDLNGSAGMFQPSSFDSRYNRHRRQWIDTTGPFAGILRLSRGWLTGEIIAHESAHAALHLWRLHNWSKPGREPGADLGEHCSDLEEAFCHLLSGIAGSVNEIVHQYLDATKEAA